MFIQTGFHTRYSKIESIGRGTFGECFTCKNKANGEVLCVKEIVYASLGAYAPEIIRLKGELERSLQVKHHNILSIVDLFDDQKMGVLHVVSPYRAGESVAELVTGALTRGKLLPERAVWSLMDGICQALQFLVSSAPLHANITTAHHNLVPSNIFLSSLSSVLISEPYITRSVFTTDSFRRNETYVAPEARRTCVATIQGNIWSVGSIVYTLTTGKNVIDAENTTSVVLPEQYSPQLTSLLSLMLSHKENERPSLAEWRATIKQFTRKAPIQSFHGTQRIEPTELMVAVMHLDIDRVYKHLNQHSARIARGMTAMMLAAESNFSAAVATLCKYESGLCNEEGDTALLIACKHDYPEIVSLLAPLEGHIRNANGLGAMYVCKKHNAINSLRIVLDLPVEQQRGILVHDEIPRKRHRSYRNTTLHTAVLLDDLQAVMRNLDLVTVLTEKGRSALSLAVEYNCCNDILSALATHEQGLLSQVVIYKDNHNNDLLQPPSRHKNQSNENLYENPSLLRQYINENKVKRCQDRWTALMFAAYHGNVEALKILLAFDKEIRVQTPHYHHTALILAVQGRNTDCVRLLAEREAAMKDRNGETALMYAARMGIIEIVQILIEYEAGLTDNLHESALFKAISNAFNDIAKLLIPEEAELVDTEETTALMLAASKGNAEIVKTLVERSIGVGKRNKFSYTALMAAAQVDARDCVLLLVSHECRMTRANGMTALMLASARNLVETATVLMKYEVGMKDCDGDTALFIAIAERADAVAILLAKTEEAHIPNHADHYPISIATQFNRIEVVRALIPMCDKRITYVDSFTPLMCAANHGYVELVELFVSFADFVGFVGFVNFVGYKDKDGWTALMFAVDKKNYNCAKILAPLEHSAVDYDGNTALSIAIALEDSKLTSLLIPYEGKRLLMSNSVDNLLNRITDEEVISLLRQISI